MKKIILMLVALMAGQSEAKRGSGIISIGTGWCNDYQSVISDWLARRADFLVQTKAPYTTAHQVMVDGVTYSFYHIPVGILQSPSIKVYIAPGTLLDLDLLIHELEDLQKLGVDIKKRVRISASAQILMPYQRIIGGHSRKKKSCKISGGIRVGAGAANADKCMGVAFRITDLMSLNYKELLKEAVERGNNVITKLHDDKPVDFNQIYELFTKYRTFLKPYVRDGIELKLNQMLSHGKVGLFDSPYATFLDSTHGTYPCTSGVSSLASSICASAGIGFKRVRSTVGIVDAYSIHPGNGRMITEITDQNVLKKVKKTLGREYRKDHHYGWLDLVMIRQAVMINGIDCIAFNGLHLLDDLDEIRMCIDYDLDGRHLDYPAPSIEDNKRVVPHYMKFEGWKTSTRNARSFAELPQEARTFLKGLEGLSGVPIALICVGPEPHQVILVHEHFFP